MDEKQRKKPLIILTGPTAVGKTDLSIQLAKRIGGAVISADSMQVYKYMDTDQSDQYTGFAKNMIGISDWSQIVSE